MQAATIFAVLALASTPKTALNEADAVAVLQVAKSACLSAKEGSHLAVAGDLSGQAVVKGPAKLLGDIGIRAGLKGSYDAWSGPAQADLLKAQQDTNGCVRHLFDDIYQHHNLSDAVTNKLLIKPRNTAVFVRNHINDTPRSPDIINSALATDHSIALNGGSSLTINQTTDPVLEHRKSVVQAIWKFWLMSRDGITNEQASGLEPPPADFVNAKLAAQGEDFRVERAGSELIFHTRKAGEP